MGTILSITDALKARGYAPYRHVDQDTEEVTWLWVRPDAAGVWTQQEAMIASGLQAEIDARNNTAMDSIRQARLTRQEALLQQRITANAELQPHADFLLTKFRSACDDSQIVHTLLTASVPNLLAWVAIWQNGAK